MRKVWQEGGFFNIQFIKSFKSLSLSAQPGDIDVSFHILKTSIANPADFNKSRQFYPPIPPHSHPLSFRILLTPSDIGQLSDCFNYKSPI